MFQSKEFFMILAITCVFQAQGADKYTDENRPYEFGFKIDGEQHRHEKKDEKGLIMGEFGFITADGVYHVTVYATDENGNFKILSMKNIRVKPYPTGPERQGHSVPFPQSKNPPQTQGPAPQKPQSAVAPSQASPAKSCSSCSIPTTTTRKPVLTDIAVVSKDQPNSQGFAGDQQYPHDSQQNYPGQNHPQSNQGPNYPQGGSQQNYPQAASGTGPNYPQNNEETPPGVPDAEQTPGKILQPPYGSNSGDRNPKQFTDYPQRTAGGFNQGSQRGSGGQFRLGGAQGSQFGPAGAGGSGGQFGPSATGGSSGEFGPGGATSQGGQFTSGGTGENSGEFGPANVNGGNGQFGPNRGQGPNKPTLISAQMQLVDKNTDIYQRKPGEKEGLPNGLTKNDMMQLLYTFNYTVGFHGHFEEGYTNGAKQGYYYVTGRNGVRTRVDYVADEKGFRPKITQEVLDLLSEDVPKPETEKDEKYGLKGYEFKWLYYPVES